MQNPPLQSSDVVPGRHHSLKEALSYYDQVLRINPRDPVILNRKAVALINLGRFEEALESSKSAASLEVNKADIWITMGVAYDNLGRFSEAAGALERAVTISPYDAYANALLAILYQKLDMGSAAETQNRRLQEIVFPREFTGYYFTLASFLLGFLFGGVLVSEGKPPLVIGGALLIIFGFFCAICILSWRSLWITHEVNRPALSHYGLPEKRGYGTRGMYLVLGIMVVAFALGTLAGINISVTFH